jgi:hypothetical protein
VAEEPGRTPPKVAEQPGRTPPLPVGIPQFANVTDQVASGLKPAIDGGLDWLQAKGYRSVLHLHAPGEDDTADRKQVEKYGMRFLSLEVAPTTLPRALDLFNRTVADKAEWPLFVYDRDGMLAGGLWYVHFLTVDHVDEATARLRATRLGLQQDQDEAHRTLWLAIQKYLSDSKTR